MERKNQTGGRPSFREKVARFLSGRNGPDELYRFSFVIWMLLFLAQLLLGAFRLSVASRLMGLLTWVAIGWQLFRCFSRNLPARRRENEAYLRLRRRLGGRCRLLLRQIRERKTHVYRNCPACKNVLRLPRVKGDHTVCCPVCRHRFQVKI